MARWRTDRAVAAVSAPNPEEQLAPALWRLAPEGGTKAGRASLSDQPCPPLTRITIASASARFDTQPTPAMAQLSTVRHTCPAIRAARR
jgi:hypothetical protein